MCKYCEGQELIPCKGYGEFEVVCNYTEHPYLYTYVFEYDDGYSIEVEINYCPMCGRKLVKEYK